jgi:tetratricopeptide (TPR) repeat protein
MPAHALRVRHLINARQFDQALAAARNAVNAAPTNPLAQALLTDVQFARNDMVNAAAGYTKLAQQNPTPELLYRLATAQAAIGKRTEAISTLEKSRNLAPGDLESLALLSTLRIAERNHTESRKLIAELKQRFPRSATGWYQEGQMYDALKQPASALEAYRNAHDIAQDRRSVTLLGMALARNGQPDAARDLLKNWLGQHPKDFGVRHQLASLYAQSDRPREAIEQYELILRQSAGDAQVLNNLAVLYQPIGDSKALSFAEKAAQAAPKNPLIQDTLGWIQVQRGQLDKGIATLKVAHAALPNNPEISLHLATALARQGDKGEARKIAQAAAQKPSVHQAALRALLGKL